MVFHNMISDLAKKWNETNSAVKCCHIVYTILYGPYGVAAM